jgi:hypothetical protein
MPTTQPDKTVKARTQHECDLCGRRIRKGATYILREGADGGKHWRFRMHPVCKAATKDWTMYDWEEWQPGDDWGFRQHVLELTPGVLAGLVNEILGDAP